MIQVREKQGLSDGQKIETEMAQQAGIKICHATTISEDLYGGLWRLKQNVLSSCSSTDLAKIILKRHTSNVVIRQRAEFTTRRCRHLLSMSGSSTNKPVFVYLVLLFVLLCSSCVWPSSQTIKRLADEP